MNHFYMNLLNYVFISYKTWMRIIKEITYIERDVKFIDWKPQYCYDIISNMVHIVNTISTKKSIKFLVDNN